MSSTVEPEPETTKVLPSKVKLLSPCIVEEFTEVRTLLSPTLLYEVIPALGPGGPATLDAAPGGPGGPATLEPGPGGPGGPATFESFPGGPATVESAPGGPGGPATLEPGPGGPGGPATLELLPGGPGGP